MYVTSPLTTTLQPPLCQVELHDDCNKGCCHTRTFSADSILFHEGDDADYAYEIVEGVVRTSKLLLDGRRQVLSFGYPGDIVGMSNDGTYHSECEALSDLRIRIFHKNAYTADHRKEPELCNRLLQGAASEVNAMQEHFLMLGRKSAMEKLASFLLTMFHRNSKVISEDDAFHLPMSRADIADFLGLTIETVSRCLTKLRKAKVINLRNAHTVQILNANGLKALAECVD